VLFARLFEDVKSVAAISRNQFRGVSDPTDPDAVRADDD
jgi:hypothetical protein